MSRYSMLECPTCGRREQVLAGQDAFCPNDHPPRKPNRMRLVSEPESVSAVGPHSDGSPGSEQAPLMETMA